MLAVIFVIAFGVYSAVQMPVNLLPDINVPMVCVQVIYAGANAPSVEKDVTEKLEEGLSSIGGVSSVDSYSYDNLSAVVLSFAYGTDTKEKQSDIRGKLSSLGLPDGVQTDVYDIDLNAEAVAVLSVTSEKGPDDAYAKGKQLAARLSAIDGVENVEIKGGAEYAYCVRPFGGLELLAPLIVEAFSYGALDIPLGNVSSADGEVQVRNNSDITAEDDIKNMPIEIPVQAFGSVRDRIKQGLSAYGFDIDDPAMAETVVNTPFIFDMLKSQVAAQGGNFADDLLKQIILKTDGSIIAKVSDVATVEKEASYSSYVYYFDGEIGITPGVTVEIYKSNGANSSAVVKEVKSVYEGAASEEGYQISVNLLDDKSQFISESISNVLISMLIGGALAVFVIFVFLKKVRTSLIIAVTMPLSVLAAIICLFAMGITLNMVSLGGLAVGIGMLVDNSIVVIESISKHRDMDKTAYRAAVDGTTEVGGALFGSTVTTVCVFIPILFSGGLTAEIFTDLSWAVIFSLSLSLIVAVTVIPALYALLCGGKRMLKGGGLSKNLPGSTAESAAEELPEKQESLCQNSPNTSSAPRKSRFSRAVASLKEPRVMNATEKFYSKILTGALKRKFIPIITAVVLFGASIGLLFVTGTEFLPSIDKGSIEVNMAYAPGTSLQTIQQDVSDFAVKIEEELKDNLDYISVSVGKNGLLAMTDTGIITVQLNTDRGTERTVEKIRELAQGDGTADAARKSVNVRQIDGVVASLLSGSDDLSVTILGEDGEKLKEIAGEIMEELKKPENGFTDVSSTATDPAWQTDIKFDRNKLAAYGLDYQTVVMTLRIGMASYTACTATIDGGECSVNVSFGKDALKDVEDLKNFTVGSGSEGAVKLSDVAEISEPHPVEACIRHSGGRQMISVSATLPGTDTGAAGRQMRKIADDVLKKYEGFEFRQSGISSYLNDAFSGLAVALVISFFLLFAVMTVQFGSAVKSLIIMASIPFSFTGGFLALVITGTSLNVVSFIGLIMLMGVVVNNAIVMLEKIKQLKNGGMTHYDAVREACKVRLRPIFMTTLTTILALIPLAVGIGKGSELMQPLGIVVIGGLLIGTLVTLVLVPSVYCAVHRLSEKFPDGKKRKSKEPPEKEAAAE